MVDTTKFGFSVPSVVLTGEGQSSQKCGLYTGVGNPQDEISDPLVMSIYFKSDGSVWHYIGDGISNTEDDWLQTEAGGGASGGATFTGIWRFDTATAMTAPANRRFRYNNATPASVTQLVIDDESQNRGDFSNLFSNMSTGDRLYIQQSNDSTKFLFVSLDSAPTDNTGFFLFDVTVIDSGALPDNNADCLIALIFSGSGTTGVNVEDEGTPVTGTPHTTLNFAGAGVTASNAGGGTALITIPGGSGTPSDQAAVQARRTTDQEFTTSFVDVPFQATDFENDAAVIEHDNVNTDRITLKEAGPYWVFYRVDADVDHVTSGFFQAVMEARVRVNDAGVDLPGSLCAADALMDNSLVGDRTVSPVLTGGFIYNATASDFLTLQIQKTESDVGGVINAAANRTLLGAIRMTGEVGPQGTPGSGSSTLRIGKTYAIAGEIEVPIGEDDFIVPFFVSLAGGQTAELVKARHQINAGTSATVKLQKNGVDITGFTGISVTTTPADTDPADVTLVNNDEIALVVTAVSGVPQNLTFTIFIEHTG